MVWFEASAFEVKKGFFSFAVAAGALANESLSKMKLVIKFGLFLCSTLNVFN